LSGYDPTQALHNLWEFQRWARQGYCVLFRAAGGFWAIPLNLGQNCEFNAALPSPCTADSSKSGPESPTNRGLQPARGYSAALGAIVAEHSAVQRATKIVAAAAAPGNSKPGKPAQTQHTGEQSGRIPNLPTRPIPRTPAHRRRVRTMPASVATAAKKWQTSFG